MDAFTAVSLIIIIYLLYRVVTLEGRVKQLQSKLNLATKQSVQSAHPIDDDLRMLIKEGKDVKAVKKAREVLGLSLIEGKQYVDRLKKPVV